MNIARKSDKTDAPYKYKGNRNTVKPKGAEVICLTGKNVGEVKDITQEYLSEKLAYFYNNGGPIMDI